MGRTHSILLAALLVALAAGCAQHYTVRLTNGNEITAYSKPRLAEGRSAFTFKDRTGKVMSVPAGKVAEISPQ